MGKRRGNFKVTKRNKEKYVPKQKYDLSQYKGKRIIGFLSDGCPIVGSKSELIKNATINNLFEPKSTKHQILDFDGSWRHIVLLSVLSEVKIN